MMPFRRRGHNTPRRIPIPDRDEPVSESPHVQSAHAAHLPRSGNRVGYRPVFTY
jgi:hypothetical protein